MISVEKFLAILEEKDLVPKDMLMSIHNMPAHHVTAAEIAQHLIDEGYLTPALANRLMGIEIEGTPKGSSGYGRAKVKDTVEDIGFAPVKEETEPRPVIGKHRYKPGDSAKSSGSASSAPKSSKPADPLPPKNLLADKPPPSRWASSLYDREVDSSKGIVSPRLVKMAGVEQIPTKMYLPRRTNWLKVLVRGGIFLGLAVILFLLINIIIHH
jgi:hypothetical protein